MGMQVDLRALFTPSVLALGISLSIVAILGKQLCGFGIVGTQAKGISKGLVGIGMTPRGEVGLIFAMIGSTLTIGGVKIIDEKLYSAIVMMVMITTMMTPPLIKWSLNKKQRKVEKLHNSTA